LLKQATDNSSICNKLRQSDFCQSENILNCSIKENDHQTEEAGREASAARLSPCATIIIIKKLLDKSCIQEKSCDTS
jgi:hypothetical protein